MIMNLGKVYLEERVIGCYMSIINPPHPYLQQILG